MNNFSIGNWLKNSGLEKSIQKEIMRMHIEADPKIKETYNMRIKDGDCIVKTKILFWLEKKYMDKNSLIKFVRCVKCFSQELQSRVILRNVRVAVENIYIKTVKYFSEVPSDAKMHDEAKNSIVYLVFRERGDRLF